MNRGFDAVALLTPTNYIGHAALSSVFMQFGKYDSWISETAANKYYEAASEPKIQKWYLTSHEFSDVSALIDRAEWLKKEIGIDSVKPLLEKFLQ